MAKPIKETPILTGDDVKNFVDNMNESENKPVSQAEKDRMQSNYDWIKTLDKTTTIN